jgi:protein TonB
MPKRSFPRWIVPAALVSLVVNVALLGTAAMLSRERAAKQDISDPVGVSLVNLKPPEPPEPEEIKEPEPPQPQPKTDFTPDLVQPALATPDGIEGGIAINLSGIGGGDFTEEFVFESYELDRPPQPVVKTPPVYPFKAREQGIEGVVQVKILVRADGSVGEVQIMAARPEGLFEDSVLRTVPKWRFRAGTIEGKAVTAWVVTAVRFTLD